MAENPLATLLQSAALEGMNPAQLAALANIALAQDSSGLSGAGIAAPAPSPQFGDLTGLTSGLASGLSGLGGLGSLGAGPCLGGALASGFAGGLSPGFALGKGMGGGLHGLPHEMGKGMAGPGVSGRGGMNPGLAGQGSGAGLPYGSWMQALAGHHQSASSYPSRVSELDAIRNDAKPASTPPKPQVVEKKEKLRCHLHVKPNSKCKKCQQIKAADDAEKEEANTKAESSKQRATVQDSAKTNFGCSPILKDQILMSSYFKSLLQITSLDVLAEEVQNYADSLEAYQAGTATVPSVFFCCVYRLWTMEHTEEELMYMMDHHGAPYARCAALMYLRFTMRPEKLWSVFQEYVLDNMEVITHKASKDKMTFGEYAESLLAQEKCYGILLPRLPVPVKKTLEDHLAPLPQHRKRSISNLDNLQFFKRGTLVEVCVNRSDWLKAKVSSYLQGDVGPDGVPWRPKLRVKYEDPSKGEEVVLMARVVLREEGGGPDRKSRSRSRSRGKDISKRSGSPDWSRYKGQSESQLLSDYRTRTRDDACVGPGKQYARRPQTFESGIALQRERGSAENRLIAEDTYMSEGQNKRQHHKPTADEIDENERRDKRKREQEDERQRNLQKIYEKYGGSGRAGGSRGGAEDGPDVMRFGV